MTGAISSPAVALEMPSQVFPDRPPGFSSPTTPRTTYGLKTKLTITALYAAAPQSHRLQAKTWRFLIVVGSLAATVTVLPVRSTDHVAAARFSRYRSDR